MNKKLVYTNQKNIPIEYTILSYTLDSMLDDMKDDLKHTIYILYDLLTRRFVFESLQKSLRLVYAHCKYDNDFADICMSSYYYSEFKHYDHDLLVSGCNGSCCTRCCMCDGKFKLPKIIKTSIYNKLPANIIAVYYKATTMIGISYYHITCFTDMIGYPYEYRDRLKPIL
jgi:hypothetical protein